MCRQSLHFWSWKPNSCVRNNDLEAKIACVNFSTSNPSIELIIFHKFRVLKYRKPFFWSWQIGLWGTWLQSGCLWAVCRVTVTLRGQRQRVKRPTNRGKCMLFTLQWKQWLRAFWTFRHKDKILKSSSFCRTCFIELI